MTEQQIAIMAEEILTITAKYGIVGFAGVFCLEKAAIPLHYGRRDYPEADSFCTLVDKEIRNIILSLPNATHRFDGRVRFVDKGSKPKK